MSTEAPAAVSASLPAAKPAQHKPTPIVSELQAAGASLRAIAAELNARGIPTATGAGEWQAPQVRRVLGRLAE